MPITSLSAQLVFLLMQDKFFIGILLLTVLKHFYLYDVTFTHKILVFFNWKHVKVALCHQMLVSTATQMENQKFSTFIRVYNIVLIFPLTKHKSIIWLSYLSLFPSSSIKQGKCKLTLFI